MGRAVPDRDRCGTDLGHAVQRADRRRLRQRHRHAGGLPGRHRRPADLLGRLLRHGRQGVRRRRVLFLHQPWPRARARHGLRLRLGVSPIRCSRCRWPAASPIFGNADLKQWLGIDVPWPVLALIMIAGIAILTYFDVKISTAVLGVTLIAEVAILVIFAVGVFGHAGNGANVQLAAINPVNALQGLRCP